MKYILAIVLFFTPVLAFAADEALKQSILDKLLVQFVAQVNLIDELKTDIATAENPSSFINFQNLLNQQLTYTTLQIATLLSPNETPQIDVPNVQPPVGSPDPVVVEIVENLNISVVRGSTCNPDTRRNRRLCEIHLSYTKNGKKAETSEIQLSSDKQGTFTCNALNGKKCTGNVTQIDRGGSVEGSSLTAFTANGSNIIYYIPQEEGTHTITAQLGDIVKTIVVQGSL